jgi:hypothetical protein
VKYTYTFVPWPDETWDFSPAMFDLFRGLAIRRLEMDFTHEEFERFRSALSHHGMTLREVQRRPYVKAESVG